MTMQCSLFAASLTIWVDRWAFGCPCPVHSTFTFQWRCQRKSMPESTISWHSRTGAHVELHYDEFAFVYARGDTREIILEKMRQSRMSCSRSRASHAQQSNELTIKCTETPMNEWIYNVYEERLALASANTAKSCIRHKSAKYLR